MLATLVTGWLLKPAAARDACAGVGVVDSVTSRLYNAMPVQLLLSLAAPAFQDRGGRLSNSGRAPHPDGLGGAGSASADPERGPTAVRDAGSGVTTADPGASDRRPRRAVLHRRITVALQVGLVLGCLLSIVEQQWLNAVLVAGIVGLTFWPALVGKRFSVFIPPELELAAIAFIVATLFLGEVQGYYLRYAWWDKLLHTTSGFLLGILGFLLVYVLNQDDRIDLRMRPFFVAVFALAFSVAAGAIWEIFEFAMDGVFGLNMQKSGLVDTMWDLIVDTIGAAVVAGLGYLYMTTDRDSFIEDWILAFVEHNPRLFPDPPNASSP